MRNSKGAKPSLQSPGSAGLREAIQKDDPRLAEVRREIEEPSLRQHAEAKSVPGPFADAVYRKVFGFPDGAFFDAATRKRLDKLAERLKAAAS